MSKCGFCFLQNDRRHFTSKRRGDLRMHFLDDITLNIIQVPFSVPGKKIELEYRAPNLNLKPDPHKVDFCFFAPDYTSFLSPLVKQIR
jgi:hypothetical protein